MNLSEISSDLFLILMAGGSGTRFWPKSTARRPKQFLSFGVKSASKDSNPVSSQETSAPSLLAQTLIRFEGIVPKNQCFVATTAALRGSVQKELPPVEILSEPDGRNTAPCIYWAAQIVRQRNPRAIMLIMPSDHFISNLPAFQATLKDAISWARSSNDLITLGIKPVRPETGYGYLKLGSAIQGACRKVEAFIEKPNPIKAAEFIRDGHYLWNGGMFLWRVDVILDAFDRWMPEMRKAWELTGGQIELAYPKMTATSIDYGVMEKAENVVTFPLDCGWDDLGSWTSLESLADCIGGRVEAGIVSGGEVLSIDSTGNIIDVPGKLVSLLGVENLIIVEHGDVLLVAQKERAQDLRKMVDLVKAKKPDFL